MPNINKNIIKLIHSTIMCNIISNIFNNSDKLSYKIFYQKPEWIQEELRKEHEEQIKEEETINPN